MGASGETTEVVSPEAIGQSAHRVGGLPRAAGLGGGSDHFGLLLLLERPLE